MSRRSQQGKRSGVRHFEQNGLGGGGTCPDCQKRRFLTRQEAKSAIRRMKHRSGRLHAYQCPASPEFWHVGHPPQPLVRGAIARDQLA